MFFNRISLTWLMAGTVALVFLMYGFGTYKATNVASKAYNQMLHLSDMHNALEENFFVLRDKVSSVRNMLNQNLSAQNIKVEEIYDNAYWVDQQVNNIAILHSDHLNNFKPQSIEKSLRFMFANNVDHSGSGSGSGSGIDDDFQQAEKAIENYLIDYQTNLINIISKSLNIIDHEKEMAKINNSLSNFNSDFDLLLSNLKAFFSQPSSYHVEVKTLLEEQTKHIASLMDNEELLKGISYLEIEKLDLLHKKAKFLTLQYYANYEEIDLQVDTDITLINNLISIWEEYDHFLDKQEKIINSIIEAEGIKSSSQIKKEGDTLFLTLIIGSILIIFGLTLFFYIAYKRLSDLRIAALTIAENDTVPDVIKQPKSKDFLATITKAFNMMIQSLIIRETEAQQYLAELSNHGEKLEKEVEVRTKELSAKNIQLTDEIQLRKQNEDQLKVFGLALSNTSEAIVITNAQKEIIEINPAYSEITGYSREEALGNNPNFCSSGHHNDEFYSDMWVSIEKNGSWSGEIINRRKSGEIFPIWETINAVSAIDGEITNYVGVFRDISDLKEVEKELHNLAYHDHLTKLPNRSLFHEHLEHEIIIAKRNGNKVAVLFIDLDRFKNVNDTLGHQVGDELLIQVSNRLKETVRESDIVARQGGDEFLILLRGLDVLNKVSAIASNIVDSLKQPFQLKNTEVFLGCSLGISIYPDDGIDVNELIKFSDTAMYHAKEMGKGRYEFFNNGMSQKNHERVELERRLNLAIEEKAFELHFQPQVNHDGNITGAEALIRWNDEDLGTVSPAKFIPIAEDNGQIHLIGKQVVEMTCNTLKQFNKSGLHDFPISINLSPMEILNPGFINDLRNTLERNRISPDRIELEVTETALLDNIETAKTTLTQLSNEGFTITLDDFGTGYSSLSYLHQLPFDRLKIDRSFISNIPDDASSIAISKTILSFARSMGMSVVAEGVETQEQQNFLWENKCDFCQGYLISKPLSVEKFIHFSNSH